MKTKNKKEEKADMLVLREKDLKKDDHMSDFKVPIPSPHPGREGQNGAGRHAGPPGRPSK